MALPSTLNFYTYTQLNTYSYTGIEGTIYFSVTVTVSGDRDIIGIAPSQNVCQVTFSTTGEVDAWECRATLDGQSHGQGIGLLVGSGSTVAANTNTRFNITQNQLTLGEGKYRISQYVKLNNIWYGG